MKASKAIKIADEILLQVVNYAYLAQEWEVAEEDDFEDLRNTIIDILAGDYENT